MITALVVLASLSAPSAFAQRAGDVARAVAGREPLVQPAPIGIVSAPGTAAAAAPAGRAAAGNSGRAADIGGSLSSDAFLRNISFGGSSLFDGSVRAPDPQPAPSGGPRQAVLAGAIKGKAGEGGGLMYARDLYGKAGFVFQATPGYFRMGGKESVVMEKDLGPGIKQQAVLQAPAVAFVPMGQVVYAPKSIGRLRPAVGMIGGVARLSALPSVTGRVLQGEQVMAQAKIRDVEVPRTRAVAALTVGAAVRVDSKGKRFIDAACGFFPGGLACASGYRW